MSSRKYWLTKCADWLCRHPVPWWLSLCFSIPAIAISLYVLAT